MSNLAPERAATTMAVQALKDGNDVRVEEMATEVIAQQRSEITRMKQLRRRADPRSVLQAPRPGRPASPFRPHAAPPGGACPALRAAGRRVPCGALRVRHRRTTAR
ncbi:DUF305 domain-containing protein [Streptomyces sp. DW4-2]|uniref:DUF305 domain-containing protein n=1 Tax=Streptomyces spirodelae TaxID=2812904 RepID=A0ABS3WWY6_9ACTN|nr:DUF305 domain-containing protein [Streptomyces spirodelae]